MAVHQKELTTKRRRTIIQWRLKGLHSDTTICLRNNQNGEREPFLKTALEETFSCKTSSYWEF